MALQTEITAALKTAMKEKNTVALEALRAIKAALLLAQTESSNKEVSEADVLKILQKLVKQRKDSAALYKEQNREDLAEPELAQAEVIAQFLPKPLTDAEITLEITAILTETGATSMKDMGRVMGMANQRMAGKADGKAIAAQVKDALSK